MLRVDWSSRAAEDLVRIESFWLERNLAILPSVLRGLYARVTWIGNDHALLGVRVPDLPAAYRWQLERTYGYKIYYRVDGDPPTSITIITIRHGLQRLLSPATIRRYTAPREPR